MAIASTQPILIPGAAGMLGRAWRELLTRKGLTFRALSRAELDLAKSGSIAAAVPAGTQLVVNCAAWTDVDGAEANEAGAEAANATGVGVLARRCAAVGAMLVHYSTDYVFNGNSTAPYRVDQPRQPLNAYGRTKAHGEELIEAARGDFLLIRTSWLYAPWAKNFVRTIAKAAKERPNLRVVSDQLGRRGTGLPPGVGSATSLRVVSDQRGRPTSSEHLAAASLGLIEKGAYGTYHVTDGGECTWFDFATAIAHWANPACRVDPCTTAEFPRPARRPAYSVLDLSKTEALLGPMPDWQTNLADVLRRLE